MQQFMDYFGRDTGFLGCLLMYFPLAVIVFSLIVTFITRRVLISPVAVFLVFGGFFLYAYSHFNTTMGDFIIPLIGYIVISFLVSILAKRLSLKIRH